MFAALSITEPRSVPAPRDTMGGGAPRAGYAGCSPPLIPTTWFVANHC